MNDVRERSVLRRLLPKLVLSVLVGGGIASLAARSGLPLVPRRAAFAHLEAWTIPAYTVVVLLTHAARAARWRHLIAPVKRLPLKEVVALNFVGFFAIFALPFRLGEAVRPALTKARHGIPVSAGVGTVAVERVLDGLVTSLCVAASLFWLPSRTSADPVTNALPTYGRLALTIFGAAFLALFLFLWQRDLARRLVRRTVGLVSPDLAEFVSSKVSSVADGLATLRDPKLTVFFTVETLFYWLLNACGMWLLAVGCGLPITLPQAIAVMGVLAIGILLPTGPGMFGPFQLATCAGLRLYVEEAMIAEQGALYVFLLYLIQLVVISIAGIAPMPFLHLGVSEVLGGDLEAGEKLPKDDPDGMKDL